MNYSEIVECIENDEIFYNIVKEGVVTSELIPYKYENNVYDAFFTYSFNRREQLYIGPMRLIVFDSANKNIVLDNKIDSSPINAKSISSSMDYDSFRKTKEQYGTNYDDLKAHFLSNSRLDESDKEALVALEKLIGESFVKWYNEVFKDFFVWVKDNK